MTRWPKCDEVNIVPSLEEQIAETERLISEAQSKLAMLKRRKRLRGIEDCTDHDFKYTGTGRHGSDKGDDYSECRKCGAKATNGKLDTHQ